MSTTTAPMFKYIIIIRQLNSTGDDGIVETFHTTDAQTGRDFLTKTMHDLSKAEGYPVVQTIGGLVPVIPQVAKIRI